jgi:hypothetical protein
MTAFFRDRDATMEKVFERLDEHGVTADGGAAGRPTEAASELLEQIKRRAAEIRDEWSERDGPNGDGSTKVDDANDRSASNDDGEESLDSRDGNTSRHEAEPVAGVLSVTKVGRNVSSSDCLAAPTEARERAGVLCSGGPSATEMAGALSVIEPSDAISAPSIQFHRMTLPEFQQHKETTCAQGDYEAPTATKEYWALIKQAFAEGKENEIPPETRRTYEILRAYPWFQ